VYQGMSFPMKNVIACTGGSISPACMESRGEGIVQKREHSNLIFTAVHDAAVVMAAIPAVR